MYCFNCNYVWNVVYIVFIIGKHYKARLNSGVSFPFGKVGDSTFYFPDREKMSKIVPFGKQNDRIYIPQYFSRWISTYKRIAKTNAPADS